MDRLPGFRDFFPEPLPGKDADSFDRRQYIADTWRRVARRYGFREYDAPPLEPLELYTTKSGEEIVGQLFNFTDKGGREVSLRPELTPSVARMVAAAERAYKKPIKWFGIPQLFRFEKQQKGRLREHFQFNADIFGEPDPAADAEIIALLIDTLREFGLTRDEVAIRLSSRQAWQTFHAERGGDPDRAYDFFQIIDKLEREAPDVTDQKLKSLGIEGGEVRRFIGQAEPTPDLAVILKHLSSRGLCPFVRIDYGIVRGLAYYTGPVFEAFALQGRHRAIAGGGRYDGLVKLVSGGAVDMPARGFGMGDVVLGDLLAELGRLPSFAARVDVVVLIEDESLRQESLAIVQELRDHGCSVDYSLTPSKPDKQFKRALELGARFSIRLERKAEGLLVHSRELASRRDEVLPREAWAATGWKSIAPSFPRP